jgi:hypothetical protein
MKYFIPDDKGMFIDLSQFIKNILDYFAGKKAWSVLFVILFWLPRFARIP